MPTQNTTPSQRIMLSGVVARVPGSEMAISLVDEAGGPLDSTFVSADGSCVLSEEALASAHGVLFEPADVLIEADRFRQLIETEKCVDVTDLLAATGQPARPSCPKRHQDHDKHPSSFAHGDPIL